ncbi:MAG: NAD(P)/FAD-dependent oxidoreductase [Deferribacteres bacterium]|nr:NAD(P)/FAD-dependent oxidoreductase [Deferribacteres bacterium]
MNYIIIGGGIAGITAAKAVRRRDAQAEITMISAEKTCPYYRPLIPLLIEKGDADVTYAEDPISEYKINLLQDRVVRVALQERDVVLASGKRPGFDKLLIATGSRPVIPGIEGISGPGIYTLRTVDDALRINAAVQGVKKAAVIGGGFVGIKAALALIRRGIEVIIIEQLGQILSRRLDARGAEIVSEALARRGIKIMTGSPVSRITHDSGRITVRLESGSTTEAGLVVVAAGVRPDIEAFRDSGIKTGRGILVGETLETNVPGIYAAGDVVEFRDLLTGRPCVSGLWSNAEEMGRIAGSNMAGDRIKFEGFLPVMNAADIAGIPLVSAGIIEPVEEGHETVTDDRPGRYRRLVFRGDRLEGALFIGDVRNAGIYVNLIKNRIPLGGLKEKAASGDLQYVHFIKTPQPGRLAV